MLYITPLIFLLSYNSNQENDYLQRMALANKEQAIRAELRTLAYKQYYHEDYASALKSYQSAINSTLKVQRLGFDTSPEWVADSWIWVARCEIKLKNLHKAIPAYRKSILWFDTNPPVLYAASSILSEYAVALARSNKLNEAKICYYASLNYLRTTNQYNEPTPFLVAFNPDPKAEVWKFNKENLIKAAMCINAMDNGFYREEFFEKYSDWDYAIQMKNAKLPGEKFTPENNPNFMRKNLQVLIKAEEELKTELPKICEKYVDPLQN